MQKKSDVIHSMVQGLKDHKNPKKVKSFIDDIKNILQKKNQQQQINFESSNEIKNDFLEDMPKSLVAEQELAKIRRKLKPN